MKNFLFFLLLPFTFLLSAENVSIVETPHDGEILISIFEKDYLNAEHTLDGLYFLASKSLEKNKSSLTATQLVQEFKNSILQPEIKQKYIDIYATTFKPEELAKIHALLENEVYLAYRQRLLVANSACQNETWQFFNKLILTFPSSSEPKSSTIFHLTKENRHEIFKSEQLLIIDVYTDWCAPCKYLAPILEELNQEYGHLYHFTKLNAEHEIDLAKEFDVHTFPTLILIKDGKEVERLAGFMSKEKLLSKLEQVLNKKS